MKRPDLDIIVVARSHWQGSSARALALVPELATTELKLESWPIGAGGAHWVLPMTGVVRLTGVVLETLEQAKLSGAEGFLRAPPEEIMADGLVAQLCALLTGLPSAGIHHLTVGLYALSSGILSPNSTRPPWLDPTLARRSLGLADGVWSMSQSERVQAMGHMSDAISARLAAALKIMGMSADGLTRRAIANRLLWVLSHESTKPDISLVAGLLKSPLDGQIVGTIEAIGDAAAVATRARAGGRKERPVDALAERMLAQAKGSPLMDADTGADWVRLFPHLVDARALKGKVADVRVAARFLEPNAVRTVSGAWLEICRRLNEWDVLASLGALVQPVKRTETGWRLDENAIADGERWSMAIPRTEPRRSHAVVAVRFGEVVGAGGDALRLAEARWQELLEDVQVSCWVADHGVAIFNRAQDAVRFAITINESFVGHDGILRVGDEALALTPGIRVPVGVSIGAVRGGTLGHFTQLGGQAVSDAIHLTGHGSFGTASHDPIMIRRVSGGDLGLQSAGVAMSRSALTAVLNGWGKPVHRHGDGSMVAEVSEDIESYPVDGWATHGDGAIVFISLGKHRGASVVEARLMGTHGLKDLVARDKQLQTGGTPDETVLLEVEDDQEADPFGFDGPAAPTEEPAKGLDSWTDIGFGDEPGSER
jgi:hypothetical protein